MKPRVFKDFNGGMVDDYTDCQPRFCQLLKNFLLDISGKVFSRNGAQRWGLQIPTAERISNLKIFRNISLLNDYTGFACFTYSHLKMWSSSSGDVTPAAGPVAWTEVKSVDVAALSIAVNMPVTARAKMQFANNHIWASFQAKITTPLGYADYTKPRKIIPHAAFADAFQCMNVGLPAYTGTPTLLGSGSTGTPATYLYYAVYYFDYTLPSGLYAMIGTPSAPVTISAYPIGVSGNTVTVGNITWPSNAANGDCYPISASPLGVLRARIYRTAGNQSTPKLVGTVSYPATSIVDSTADGALGAPLYTADGTQPYDQPKPCKIMHIVGDVAYFGGFDIGTLSTNNFPQGFQGAIQATPGVFDSAPGANTIATPDHLTAIENVDIYPVFFTRFGSYRVEGTIDAFGNGNPVLRTISEKAGALSQNLVCRTEKGLLFCAYDGVYFTDGFTAIKLTDHLNRTYQTLFTTQAAIDAATLVYQQDRKRFFISVSVTSLGGVAVSQNSVGGQTAVLWGDLKHQTDEGGAAIGYFSGESSQAINAVCSFTPMGLEYFQGALFMGDAQGYIQQIYLEPETSTQVLTADDGVDTNHTPSAWFTLPINWDYISGVHDFEQEVTEKWISRLLVTFRLRFPALQSAIYALFTRYNEGSFQSDSNASGQVLQVVRDQGIPAWRGLWTVTRRMPANGIRSFFSQIRIQKPTLILYSSKPAGTRVLPASTVSITGSDTASISGGFWPADVVGATISFSFDNYATSYSIAIRSSSTLVLRDPGATLQAGFWEWQISGMPKDQGVAIKNYAVAYDDIVGHGKPAGAADTGANA